MDYAGPHRKIRAGSLMETYNSVEIKDERGKWRNILRLKFIYESLRSPQNCVRLSREDPGRPEVVYEGHTEYTKAGIQSLSEMAGKILSKLPVEKFKIRSKPEPTEAHIIGTTVMGTDNQSSIVDQDCIMHLVRNVIVLGSSVFPTAPPANPTLTICALALRAAERLFQSRG
jgi:choline dehydrogenase-like flavoprotein